MTDAGEIQVRVTPRASRSEIAGERGGRLLVRVTAPPAEGRANDAVRDLVARRLRIARGRVQVVRGHAARDKTLRIEGVTTEAARRALGLPKAP